jgi:hypothetical protein
LIMSQTSKKSCRWTDGKTRQILVLILLFLSMAAGVQAQYLGTTCGYDYNNDLQGPDTGTDNTPLFNSLSGNPNATWDDWAEEIAASGVDYVCPNLRGSYPNTSVNPTNIAGLLLALSNRGLTNQIKLAIFDDNASSWTAQYNQALGYGYGYTVPFDIGNSNNWVYLWDYNYKLFYQTVPDSNRFKINGRPLIIIWTGNTYFITNMQGNASRALTYVRQQCQSTFGFNPYIILSSDFLPHDTTCNNTNVTDAVEAWFDPNSVHTNGQTLSTFNGIKIGALCPQFQDPNTDPSAWLDPQHGIGLAYGLTKTCGAGALLTLVEGFSDWEEDASCFRVRNLDANGDVLSYASTYYDYPNQRLNLLRQGGSHPFPVELKFEAEACDYFGGAAGGNGKTNYYRNGNIAIEPATDTGGGYDVGWIQPGEWLEWEQVPIQGSLVHLQVRIASPNSSSQLHFVIDGTNYPALTLLNTGGYQTWATVDSGTTYQFAKNSTHTVRLVCDTGGFNLNYWKYHDDIPTGANVRLQSKASSKWVSATNVSLFANVSVPGTNELFTVNDASGIYGYGYVALQAQANGKYVTADTNGVAPLIANATTVGTSQMFEWADNGDGTILLRAVANSLMVSATNNPGSYPLIPNRIRSNVGLPETFAVTQVSSNALSFVAQPNDTAVATAITAGALGEVQVVALNAANVPVAGVPVMIGIASGAGSITGNSATTDGSGIAHFTGLQINNVGAKALQASSSAFSSTTSSSFNIIAGPPSALTVETQPDGSGSVVAAQNVAAGSSINAYAIYRDSYGNFATNVPATWSLMNITGGVTGGDLVHSGDARSASFTGHLVGSAIIQAAAAFTGQSGVQTVTGGAAANLVITQQPSASGKVGLPFAQQPIVTETDGYGNLAASPVAVTETGGAGNVNLNPNGIVATPVNGVAAFAGLYLTNFGISSLTFTAGSASIQSGNIIMSIGNVERLVWATPPGKATNGFVFGTSPVIQTVDAGGNVTTQGLPAVKYISVNLYSGAGTLSGTMVTNIGTTGANGSVTLTNLGISAPGIFQLGVQDIGNGYTPTNITGGGSCQLWLDAADTNTLNSSVVGSTISQWSDKSGHANNASGAATLAIDPLLTVTSPGQAQTIHFNGSQQLTMNLNSLSNSSYTILVMEVGASKASGSSYFIGNNGGFNTDLTLGVGYQTATQFRWQQYADDLNYNATLTNVAVRQWTMNLNATPQKNLYLNSTLVGTAPSAYLKGPNLVNGTVGYKSYLGDLAEIIVYNMSLTLNDQTNLQNYLANKWLTGLSAAVTQPFVVVAPVYNPSVNSVNLGRTGGVLSTITILGAGGPPGGSYRVLSTTNLTAPMAGWIPVRTNQFDGNGAFSNAIPVNPAEPTRFYRLIQP